MADWLTEAYGIPVERIEVKRPGGAPYYRVAKTGKGCLHTTEGSSVAGAIGTFRAKGFAPTFLTGEGRIVQCRPLWAQASTLHTGPRNCNNIAQVQIEQVGFSKEGLYDLPDATRTPSVHLLAALLDEGIPLVIPNGDPVWWDNLADCSKPLAWNNSRRRSERFYGAAKGWYMHLEVPDQDPSWHWDCGAIRRTTMLVDAQALIPPPGGDDMTYEEWSKAFCAEVGVQSVSALKTIVDSAKGMRDGLGGKTIQTGQGASYKPGNDAGLKIRSLP